jgi:hypothetical protein
MPFASQQQSNATVKGLEMTSLHQHLPLGVGLLVVCGYRRWLLGNRRQVDATHAGVSKRSENAALLPTARFLQLGILTLIFSFFWK